MQFSIIFASAAAFAIGASAAAIRDVHVSDFRIFGENGCSAQNLGVWTVLDTDINQCTGFNAAVVKSVTLTDINQGCELLLFTDDECTAGQITAQTEICNEGDGEWKKWKIVC